MMMSSLVPFWISTPTVYLPVCQCVHSNLGSVVTGWEGMSRLILKKCVEDFDCKSAVCSASEDLLPETTQITALYGGLCCLVSMYSQMSW